MLEIGEAEVAPFVADVLMDRTLLAQCVSELQP